MNRLIQVTIPDLPFEIREQLVKKYDGVVYQSVNQLDATSKKKVEVLVSYGYDITSEMLVDYPSLKWVQIFQTGLHHLPLQELKKRNIVLTNVRGIYGIPISEYVLSFILYFVRDFERYRVNKINRIYERGNLPDEAGGKTLVILGAGTIGNAIAEMGKKIGMNVVGVNTTGKIKPFFDQMYSFDQRNEAIAQGDFVVCVFPVTEKTRESITKNELAFMKQSAYFMNIGRAELINEQHLIEHLHNNKIKGAVLDVFQQEPLPKTSPLWDLPNVYLTPHISGKTKNFFSRCLAYFDLNISAYKNSLPMTFVFDYDKGY